MNRLWRAVHAALVVFLMVAWIFLLLGLLAATALSNSIISLILIPVVFLVGLVAWFYYYDD